jgi:hypothetical protein
MPTDMTERGSESNASHAPATTRTGGSVTRDDASEQTHPASTTAPAKGHQVARKRALLIGVTSALVLAVSVWFGIPWIRMTLKTVSVGFWLSFLQCGAEESVMDHHMIGPVIGNLIIILGAGAITVSCFVIMFWMLLRPGETDPHHPKHDILRDDR